MVYIAILVIASLAPPYVYQERPYRPPEYAPAPSTFIILPEVAPLEWPEYVPDYLPDYKPQAKEPQYKRIPWK